MKNAVKTVVFISNFFNHHQRPFSEAMYGLLGDGYAFVETESISQERLAMGWGEQDVPSYVVPANVFTTQREKVQQLIDNADVVIFGSAPRELLVNRIQKDKMIFRYSERPLKVKEPWKYPVRLVTWRRAMPQKKHTYMLCASAYTAGDFAQFGLFRNKCYKWGYFPATKRYDIDALFAQKSKNERPSILWAGRLIGWKHPDASILLAEQLKANGYRFDLNIIGNGAMESQIRAMIREKKLDDCVHMLGGMRPERVREYMERADIYLFTSDFNEGWGAVLNESMNSGCAVVASHAIGSVPFLVCDGENGMIYCNGDADSLYNKVSYLLDHPLEREKMGKNAYETLTDTWNAETAAERLLVLIEQLMDNGSTPFKDGPCSKAEHLKDNWYK